MKKSNFAATKVMTDVNMSVSHNGLMYLRSQAKHTTARAKQIVETSIILESLERTAIT